MYKLFVPNRHTVVSSISEIILVASKMEINVLMLPLLLFLVSPASSQNCSHIFEGQPYSRSAILTIKGLPTNLVYNPITKDLLFTLIDLESLHNDEVQTKMDQYVLREGQPIKIDNIKGQAAAVDVTNKRVYIASDDGIYTLDSTNKANFYSLKDEDIVQLFKPVHKDVLYATMFPENDLYAIDLKKNEKTRVANVPCAYFLAVDGKDNIFYECNSKYVKVLLKGFEEPIEFVGIAKNSARAIALDGYDRAILAANDGLYHLRPDNIIPVKLMNFDITPSGLEFADDDFYVSTNGVVYKYSSDECVTEEKNKE